MATVEPRCFLRNVRQVCDPQMFSASHQAASDQGKASASVLKGTEPLAFEFSYALALLDAGRAPEAAKLFRRIGLKEPIRELRGFRLKPVKFD